MEDSYISNRVELCGVAAASPRVSHESRGIRFLTFPLEVRRLSGTADRINVICREDMLDGIDVDEGLELSIDGELRSFNNKSGQGNKLVITVFARELSEGFEEERNAVYLTGTLCKEPNLRVTPMGREICDLMLAVQRRYNRSDYLPCIAWGLKAREASLWAVGDVAALEGRIQSRRYIKNIDGKNVEKTAFEVSVIDIGRVADDEEL